MKKQNERFGDGTEATREHSGEVTENSDSNGYSGRREEIRTTSRHAHAGALNKPDAGGTAVIDEDEEEVVVDEDAEEEDELDDEDEEDDAGVVAKDDE